MAKIYSIILCICIFGLLPFSAHAATLSVSPSSGTYEVGERITLKVLVSGGSTSLNAVSGTLSLPSSVFSIESVSKVGSVLNFWVTEPAFSASKGTVSFEGVSLGGFQGDQGTVVTVTVRAIAPGQGSVSFSSGHILANDGQGTEVMNGMRGAAFSIVKPVQKVVPPKKEIPKVTPVEVQPEITKVLEVLLTPPEIARGVQKGRMSIVGRSVVPKTQVVVTFVAQDTSKVFIVTTTDNDGRFEIPVPTSLKRGIYSVSAVIVKGEDKQSDTSNALLIEVGSIISDMSWEAQIAFILLILIILYLLLRINFHFRNIRSKIRRDVSEAENTLHESFDVLRKDMTERVHEKTLAATRKEVNEITKDINTAENTIHKEIKDIGK